MSIRNVQSTLGRAALSRVNLLSAVHLNHARQDQKVAVD